MIEDAYKFLYTESIKSKPKLNKVIDLLYSKDKINTLLFLKAKLAELTERYNHE